MHYFALLLSPEATSAPDPQAQAAEMAAYQTFHVRAASAIRAGDALTPSATGVRITGGPDAPTITDGPFAEAPRWPAATTCSRPTTSTMPWLWPATSPPPSTAPWRCGRWSSGSTPTKPLDGNTWLALLLEPPRSRGDARNRRSGRPASRKHVEVRRRRRRPTQRRRGLAPADDGDDGAGARRPGGADRRPVRRGRRGRQRLLPDQHRPTATRRSRSPR